MPMGTGKTSIVETLRCLGLKVFEPDEPRSAMTKQMEDKLKELRRAEKWDEHNAIFWKSQYLWLTSKEEEWDVIFAHGKLSDEKKKVIPIEAEIEATMMLSDPLQHIVGVIRRTEAGETLDSDTGREDVYNAIKLCAMNSLGNLEDAEFFFNQAGMTDRILELLGYDK